MNSDMRGLELERLPKLPEVDELWGIYNAEKTGYSYNCLSDRTLALKVQSCYGAKVSDGNSTAVREQ
jgi:hypothetical protein